MAGYTKIYCIGGEGGFMGADGVNPICAQIWRGDGSRPWYEAQYFDAHYGPLGGVQRFLPQDPSDPDNLLDACLLFFPDAFKECPSLATAEKRLRKDVDFGAHGVPDWWKALREEARPAFSTLGIFEAEIRPLRG